MVLSIKVKNSKGRTVCDEEVDVVGYGAPDSILVTLTVLKSVADKIWSIGRAEYFDTLDLYKLMLKVYAPKFELMYDLITCKLNELCVTLQL